MRVQLWVCPDGYPHVLYSFFPPDKHFTCFTNFHLCGVFCKCFWGNRALLVGQWSSRTPARSPLQPNFSLWPGTETLLQAAAAEATWGHIWCWNLGGQGEPWTQPSCSFEASDFHFAFFLLLSALLSFQDPGHNLCLSTTLWLPLTLGVPGHSLGCADSNKLWVTTDMVLWDLVETWI